MLPYVLLKFAVSLDGCLDDSSPQRLLLSNRRDFEALDAERAAADAVLVGANTIRRDNPRLRIRDVRLIEARVRAARPPQPLRASWTRRADMPTDAAFFEGADAPRVVFCPAASRDELCRRLAGRADVAQLPDANPVQHLLAVLAQRGVRRLLVEGGAQTLAEFLRCGAVDELQMSVAPLLVGDQDAIRWRGPGDVHSAPRHLRLETVHRYDEVVAMRYRLDPARPPGEPPAGRDRRCMGLALRESLRCERSARRFAVGCVIADSAGAILATGYTGSGHEAAHAEEAALDSAERLGHDLRGATLYATLEPCARRASGPRSCVDRILAAAVPRVVYALAEPPTFQPGGGARLLAAAGVRAEVCAEFADAVRAVNDHLPGVAAAP